MPAASSLTCKTAQNLSLPATMVSRKSFARKLMNLAYSMNSLGGNFSLRPFTICSQPQSLLITSQYPKEKWYDLFTDPTIADAVLDRIVHKAHVIPLKGESMRKLKSRKS
uniref:ATP-binding protein n=1 Tax=Pseudomonas chlororaphis TaxID=587753 RepID=UPI003857B027